MKKKILFTTVHPAPYIDRIIDYLSVEYCFTVLYNYRNNNYKQWKHYQCYEGKCFSDLSFLSLIRYVCDSDFVIVGGWGSWNCIKLILLTKMLKKRVAVFSDCPCVPNKRSLKYRFKRYILFPLLDYLFCATDTTSQLYHEYYGVKNDKMIFFPYAIDFPVENQSNQMMKLRISQLLGGELLKIFIANNFYERKGYHVILNAFKYLADWGILNKFQITIAGVGEEAEYYKNELSKLSSSIVFLGWLEVDEYCNYMNQADIYIHASLHEPFGIPPLDAMIRGKCVIVSNEVQSTNSLIENGINGYKYPALSAEKLAELLKNIDIEKMYEIGLNAQKSVAQKYSYQIYLDALHGICPN